MLPHNERLLQKLSHYGITGNIHAWITSFLKDRSQSVRIDGARSDKVHVGSGVPPGYSDGVIALLAVHQRSTRWGIVSCAALCRWLPTIQADQIRGWSSPSPMRPGLPLMLGWDVGREIQPAQVPHHVSGNYQEVLEVLLITWMHTIPGVTLQVLGGDPEWGPAMESTCLISHSQSKPGPWVPTQEPQGMSSCP